MSVYSIDSEPAIAAVTANSEFDAFDKDGTQRTKKATAAQIATYAQNLANFRNLIDGGDFTVNPFQRGTSQAADIAATGTYGPDRWYFKGGASSAINWSSVTDTSIAGFGTALKFQRKSANADTAAVNMAQELESVDSIRAQGQQVTLSFWAKAGANFSGANLVAQVESGTGTDEGASALVGGSWTGQTHVINTTQVLITTMTRYSFTGTVPAGCTELGVIFQFTPVGTAGANDFVQLNGIQLEIGGAVSSFEHRDVEVELALCQRYFFNIAEPATGVIVGAGMISATNAETIFIPLPVQMRAAPTVTVTAGLFKFNIAGTPTAVGGGFAAGTTHTVNYISVVGTVTATVGQATLLQGGGGTGKIAVSADF
jgi:hypothetical protein